MFKKSANELKNIRCLTVTGVLVAAYVTLNSPLLSYNTDVLKITFGFLALAAIGMLFGPVVAVIASVPCDIIAAYIGHLGVNPIFTIPKILEGLIYGIFLYGMANSGNIRKSVLNQAVWSVWQVMRIVLARFLVMSVCYLLVNSLLLYYITKVSSNAFGVFMYPRFVKNAIQFPVDLALMFVILPPIGVIYKKAKGAAVL